MPSNQCTFLLLCNLARDLVLLNYNRCSSKGKRKNPREGISPSAVYILSDSFSDSSACAPESLSWRKFKTHHKKNQAQSRGNKIFPAILVIFAPLTSSNFDYFHSHFGKNLTIAILALVSDNHRHSARSVWKILPK